MEREVVILRLVHFVERVPPNPIDVDTEFRVRLENLPNNVFCVRRQELWEGVVGGEDFLVEIRRFLVFERQVAADHCVEDDADGPNVRGETVVAIARNHLQKFSRGGHLLRGPRSMDCHTLF